MRAIGRALFAASIAAVLAGPARAQDAPHWELGAFGGGFFGSRISLTPSEATLISSGATFGLRGAFETAPHFRLQASFSTANVRVVTQNPLTGARLGPDVPGHVRTYELDWLYGFGRGRLRGFAGLGAGVMTLPPLQTGETTGGDTRFTANIAVGGEYFLNERLAVVLEGRYRWRETGQRLGTIVCESDGCEPFLTNLFSSAEATAGFTYRFGDVRPFPSDPIGDVTAEESDHRYPGLAAAEVFLFELLPWAVNRYISEADYAYVTADSIKAGFRTGFTYDRDSISTNVFNHPIHGNMYFSSARSNGYGFWESGAVTLLGSFLWECCAESEPPAINDLVNTTLGGMVIGEVTYRLSSMLWAGGDGGSRALARRAPRCDRPEPGRRAQSGPARRGRPAAPRGGRAVALSSGPRCRVPARRGRRRGPGSRGPRGPGAVRRSLRGRNAQALRLLLARRRGECPRGLRAGAHRIAGDPQGMGPVGRERVVALHLRPVHGLRVRQQRCRNVWNRELQRGLPLALPPGARLRRRRRPPGERLPAGGHQDRRRARPEIHARLRLRLGRRPEHRRPVDEVRLRDRDALLRRRLDGHRERRVDVQHAPVLPGGGAAPDRGRIRRGRELLPVSPPDVVREPALADAGPSPSGARF